jgi:small subunit ribosomal protein S20
MANHKSAIKKAKQDIVRRARNRSGRSRLRTLVKRYRAGLAEGNTEISSQLTGLISMIDRSAKSGYIHRNAAARLKSKLSKQTNALVNA